ncbi:alpha/beta fold hydrolase [Paenibacillus jiagnxiensis]|uniref:alpha/beta fold hydrolase n=1 Tax=Paenibacillus jiagnxiensis TaxID=3228926 RepID=UPI0038D46679
MPQILSLFPCLSEISEADWRQEGIGVLELKPHLVIHEGHFLEHAVVTHEQIVQSVVNVINSNKLDNIVLVGHSFGGTVIQKVAEQIPDRIHRLVFFDAFVPLDGQSLVDQAPPALQTAFEQLKEASGNNTSHTIGASRPIPPDYGGRRPYDDSLR